MYIEERTQKDKTIAKIEKEKDEKDKTIAKIEKEKEQTIKEKQEMNLKLQQELNIVKISQKEIDFNAKYENDSGHKSVSKIQNSRNYILQPRLIQKRQEKY